MPVGCSDVAMPRAGSLTGDHAWQVWEQAVCPGLVAKHCCLEKMLLISQVGHFLPRRGGWVGSGAVPAHLLPFPKCTGTHRAGLRDA